MKTLIIYFTADKRNYQIVHPHQDFFKGDWAGLVESINNGIHHSYEVF